MAAKELKKPRAGAKRILILNGPNLNLLGLREPEIYGRTTLGALRDLCADWAKGLGFAADFRQSNAEGTLIDWIHESRAGFSGLILNAGAYTHSSIALYDALKSVPTPAVEVHLSNPFAREPFRHQSYISPAAIGLICGFGTEGYRLALEALAAHLNVKGAKA
jgi:3-dehydroquinate dehydratase-2